MNQIWDFSNIADTSSRIVNWNYTNTSTFEYDSLFPHATMGVLDINGSNSERYYKIDSLGIEEVGKNAPGIGYQKFTKGISKLKFPLTLNSQYTDSIYGIAVYLPDDTIEVNGVSIITGDGFGELVLPYGTIDQVLRIKVESQIDQYHDGTFFQTEFLTDYYYYTIDNNNLIATAHYAQINGGNISRRNFLYQSESSLNHFNTNEFSFNDDLILYPNPSKDYITIGNLKEQSIVTIYDINGKIVKSSSQNHINISHLSPGYYMVHISTPFETQVQKLMVE